MSIVYNQWIDCTDENYWQTEDDICFVPPIDDESEYLFFGSKRECPYGWNVLVRNNAKFMTVEFPNIKNNEHE